MKLTIPRQRRNSSTTYRFLRAMLTRPLAGWQLLHLGVSMPPKICEKFEPILIAKNCRPLFCLFFSRALRPKDAFFGSQPPRLKSKFLVLAIRNSEAQLAECRAAKPSVQNGLPAAYSWLPDQASEILRTVSPIQQSAKT